MHTLFFLISSKVCIHIVPLGFPRSTVTCAHSYEHCPEGFDVPISQIFYETYPDPSPFKSQGGEYTLSNSDPIRQAYIYMGHLDRARFRILPLNRHNLTMRYRHQRLRAEA